MTLSWAQPGGQSSIFGWRADCQKSSYRQQIALLQTIKMKTNRRIELKKQGVENIEWK